MVIQINLLRFIYTFFFPKYSANAINHLASEDHAKNLKHFLWKYGGEMNHMDTYRILEADITKVS